MQRLHTKCLLYMRVSGGLSDVDERAELENKKAELRNLLILGKSGRTRWRLLPRLLEDYKIYMGQNSDFNGEIGMIQDERGEELGSDREIAEAFSGKLEKHCNISDE